MSGDKVERFEDLIAWKKARELTKQIYCLTSKEPFVKDFGLRDQIQRASISIMSNLAEVSKEVAGQNSTDLLLLQKVHVLK
jgi:four helix bundle protein